LYRKNWTSATTHNNAQQPKKVQPLVQTYIRVSGGLISVRRRCWCTRSSASDSRLVRKDSYSLFVVCIVTRTGEYSSCDFVATMASTFDDSLLHHNPSFF